MTIFAKRGNCFYPKSNQDLVTMDKLPPGNYTVMFSNQEGYFLEKINDFTPIKKKYGNLCNNTDRILKTFELREKSTGVLFSGIKGSGKSLLAKNISLEAYSLGMPTIVVSDPYYGPDFNQFLELICQPCIVLFDEFEKTYDAKKQEHLLTVLDGILTTKKLFILTINNKYRVDNNIINRPGRIFYMIEFNGINEKFVKEYCVDNLKNLDYLNEILFYSSSITDFTFDMLQSLVEESNRYNESPNSFIDIINIKAEFMEDGLYNMEVFKDEQSLHKQEIKVNLLSNFSIYIDVSSIDLEVYSESEEDVDSDVIEENVVKSFYLVSADYVSGTPAKMHLAKHGYDILLSKKEREHANFKKFL